MCQSMQLYFAVLRIGLYTFFRRICGKAPAAPKPTFSVLCLGLANSGKSTILTLLSGENADGIRPTVGFSIKALMFADCFVDVKELGGSDNVRMYWNKYFCGAQAVIFVIDSAGSKESMETANAELHKALADPELDGLPLLVLGNHQDKEGARSKEQITKELELGLQSTARKWIIHTCSMKNKEEIMAAFQDFNKLLLEMKEKEEREDKTEEQDGEFSKI